MRIAQGSLGKLVKEQIISLQTLTRASLTDIIHVPLELFLEFYPKDPGPVVWRLISANPWLNFILGFFIPLFKSLYRIIFSVPFRESNYIVDKKNCTEFSFKAFRSEIIFHTLTIGYLNQTMNNLALDLKVSSRNHIYFEPDIKKSL